MLVKRVCIAALIVFASIGLSSAQEPIYSQFDRLVFDPARPPVPIEGAELQTNVTNAGSDAELTVSFITPDLEFPYDYKVGVTFPPHFDMSAGVTAVFSDDAPPPDPEIRAINYIGNTVVFTFRRSFFAPKAGQRGSIKILGATLPESVGTYAATVFVADTAFLTLAGPSITNGITVTPGPVASIALKPDKNIIVKAGTTIQFTVDAVDEFGNHISASLLNWRLDESRDSIGVVTALNLFANRVGQGRVIVSDNGHADTSGNITVTPGDLARIELDIETRQPA